ncbi:MAG: hypothetical protein H0X58_05350 [Acidimicrobiia bacterium]|nr:hypothetical protein [Acidimicrobiia bacterium]
MAYLAHPLLTIAGFALLPRVFRRFGYGYGTYALLVIGLSCLGTKNFFGMARYVMAAFPCFAVAGDLLASGKAQQASHGPLVNFRCRPRSER